MIAQIPHWINAAFMGLVIFSVLLFHCSNAKPWRLTLAIVIWGLMQSALAYLGFYQDSQAMPPRYGLVLIPVVMTLVYGLTGARRERAMAKRQLAPSTLLHSVRIGAELILFYLFGLQMIPELMTYEGANFDIIMGITAPIMAYLFIKQKLSKKALLVWNLIGLVLILNILIIGIFSAELPIQLLSLEQPNRALTYFPYVLLPGIIVPIVIYTHVIDIMVLRRSIAVGEAAKA